MALRFYYEWTDSESTPHRVDIYDSEYTGVANELTASETPFQVEVQDKGVFGNPVKTSSGNLSFISYLPESETRDLFTADIRRYKVIHTIDSVINWGGYLNSEVYSEDYSYDYQSGLLFNINANNGFGILDRVSIFTQAEYEAQGGDIDLTTLLKHIINKIGLGYEYLYLNLDFTIDSDFMSGFDKYSDIRFNTSNYIDEDGEFSDCRSVLNGILVAFRLQLVTDGADVWIESLNSKIRGVNTDTTFKKYTLASTVDVTILRSATGLHEVEDSEWYNTGQNLSYDSSINKQIIAPDLYIDEDILPNRLSDINLLSGTNTTTIIGIPSIIGYGATFESYSEHSDLIFTEGISGVITTTEYHESDADVEEVVSWSRDTEIVRAPTTTNVINGFDYDLIFQTKKLLEPTRTANGTASLKLEMDLMLQGGQNAYRDPDDAWLGFELGAYIKIGIKYLTVDFEYIGHTDVRDGSSTSRWNAYKITHRWTTTPSTFPIVVTKPLGDRITGNTGEPVAQWQVDIWGGIYDYFKVSNQFDINDGTTNLFSSLNEGMSIPLLGSDMTNHELVEVEFGVFNYYANRHFHYLGNTDGTGSTKGSVAYNAKVYDGHPQYDSSIYGIFIRNFKLSAGDYDTNQNVESVWDNPNTDYKDSGEDIIPIIGTAMVDVPLQRGAIFIDGDELDCVTEANPNVWRDSDDNLVSLEDMNLRSVVTNRGEPTVVVNGDIEHNSNINKNSLVSFPTLDDKVMMFTGGTIDYMTNNISGSWKEVRED